MFLTSRKLLISIGVIIPLILSPSLCVASEKIIGLIEVPKLFGTRDMSGPPGLTPPKSRVSLKLYAQPSTEVSVIALVSEGSSIETREYAYEAKGAVVYQVMNDWVRLKITDQPDMQFGWLSPEGYARFHPLDRLLQDSLTYLTDDWDGLIFSSPSLKPRRLQTLSTKSIRVIATHYADETLWLRVEFPEHSVCTGITPRRVIASGWIPAHGTDGKLNAWFYSRGC